MKPKEALLHEVFQELLATDETCKKGQTSYDKNFAAYLKSSKGKPSKVTIWIDKASCDSCSTVIRDFERQYGVTVEVISP